MIMKIKNSNAILLAIILITVLLIIFSGVKIKKEIKRLKSLQEQHI